MFMIQKIISSLFRIANEFIKPATRKKPEQKNLNTGTMRTDALMPAENRTVQSLNELDC